MRIRHIYKSGWALLVVVLLGQFALPGAAYADERILGFDSTITVNPDGTLTVREAIRVRAEGRKIRRGIFRDFPTNYPRAGGGQVVVGFAFESATRDGNPEPWRREARDNGVRIYLGSAAVQIEPGEHTYELLYRTDRQMGYFANHDELYWNVTGNGWDFPIDRATAQVLLPESVPRAEIKLEAYTGAQGATGRAYTATLDGDAPLFATTQALGAREGLTIVAMWPKGHIMPAVEAQPSAAFAPGASESPGYDYARDAGHAPDTSARTAGWSPAERIVGHELPKDSRPALFALLGLAFLVLYYYLIWDKVGRDPPGRLVIPEYEMPAGQSAASMRYLVRMGYDDETFAAGVLSLAVKGYLRIEQDAGVLGLGKAYTLVRENPGSGKALNAEEQALLTRLFRDGDSLKLEQKSHRTVRGARTAHKSALAHQYAKGFFSINGGWHFLGIVLSLLVGALAFAFPGGTDNWPQWYFTTPLGWFTVGAVFAGLVVNGVFGKLLKARTVAGRAALDHIQGFKMYLEVAEGEELKRLAGPPPPQLTPQIYEAYLPAALALGVEQRWAEKFTRVLEIDAPDYRPAWYAGSAWNAANVGRFSSQLGSSLSSAISSSSTAPGSKSGGGGGGSSGGGGGGGGGGGW